MADESMTVMNGLLEGLVKQFKTVDKNTKDTAVEVSMLGDNLIDAIMDSSETSDKQSKKQSAESQRQTAVIIDAAESTNKEIESSNNKLIAAEEILDTSKNKKQNALLEAIRDKTSMLGQSTTSLSNTIKDDFNQLMAPLSMIAQAPGVKTLIAIVKTLALAITTPILAFLAGKFFKQITAAATDKDGKIDRTKQMQGIKDKFTPKFMRSEEQQTRRDEVKKTPVPGKPDLKKMGEGMTGNKPGRALNDPRNNKEVEKSQGAFQKASIAMSKTMSSIATTVKGLARSMAAALLPMALAVKAFVASMIAASVAFLVANLPIILVVGALILLAVGIFFIAKYLSDNWEKVKEKFMLGVDQLGVWGSIAGNFIRNMGKSVWMGLRSLFVKFVTGIESFANSIITSINDYIPGSRMDLSPLDLGSKGMKADLDADNAAFAAEKITQSEDIASRQKDIDDRTAAMNAPQKPDGAVVVSSNVNNTNANQTTVIPLGTTPTDAQAAQLAMFAQ